MRFFQWIPFVATLALALTAPATAETPKKCPNDSMRVGPACVDKYEASVWQIPASAGSVIARVKAGKATLADLTAAGATQVSLAPTCNPAVPASFPVTGNWTAPLYAVSIPGVQPAGCLSWFQAEQACALSGKRLLTNQEWQRAAAGTPDPGSDDGTTQCKITAAGGAIHTGARSACVSSWGIFDMVGNVGEWVADWAAETNSNCSNWPAAFGNDTSCFGGNSDLQRVAFPVPMVRGGGGGGTEDGVFAIFTSTPATATYNGGIGFRCGR